MKKIQKNEITQETKKSIVARVITAIFIAIVGIPCVMFGEWFFFGLVLLITILSALELNHITDLKGSLKAIISVITVILTVAIVYYIFYKNYITEHYTATVPQLQFDDNFLTERFSTINISVMLVILMAAIYFIISFFSVEFTVRHVFYLVTMVLVVAIGAQSFLFLRYSPSHFFSLTNDYDITTNSFKWFHSMFLFLYVLIGVIMNDIGAFFIGILFGKHKMNEKISPKKTWEGFLGGVVFSLISSSMFAIIVTYCNLPLLPIFDFRMESNPFSVFFIVGISILLPLFADIGDFVFSSIKRFWGVKDFSKLLPGHGGILDRIDSLIFASALVSCLITFINLFWYGIGAM